MLYLADGASSYPPSFVPQVISSSLSGACSVTAADLDGDGHVDALSASYGDDKVMMYMNNGASPPAFSPFLITDRANAVLCVSTAFIDQDDALDGTFRHAM